MNQYSPFLLLVLLLSISTLPIESQRSTADADALLALKQKWQAVLPTWINGTDPCRHNWEGVTCSQGGRVYALNLTNKGLKGPVPNDISNLVALTKLDISNIDGISEPWNYVSGDLSQLGSLTNLQLLNLSYNLLDTEFPLAVLQLTNLTALILSNTYLKGPFPEGLSKLPKLQYLYLGNCSMTGDLPSEIGALSTLLELSLWNNQFNSKIPVELGNLVHLVYMNLHSSGLWGGLPIEFSKLRSLQRLYLYNNDLTGFIPDSWNDLQNLEDLRLEYNFLTGNFPSWILQHANLQYLELAYNQMYGNLPNLSNSHFQTLRFECNFFQGEWPVIQSNTVFFDEGNCFSNVTGANDTTKYICTRQVTCSEFFDQMKGPCPPCPPNQTFVSMQLCICGKEEGNRSSNLGKIIGFSVAAVFVLIFAFFILTKWRKSKSNDFTRNNHTSSFTEDAEPWEVPEGVHMFTFQELAKATGNFHKDYEIGMGGFGKVFRGTLESGKRVAVKRAFNSKMQATDEFRNEVILLSRLHHRNLVHLEGLCEERGVQILVYEFLENGNLHAWLGRKGSSHTPDLLQRLNVALGVAHGLDYLHSFADPPVIHRDVKPSNILLDENLVPKLADFGLSRLTSESQTHLSTSPAGTAGYIDPQYFLRRQLTSASDVYSFGVVLLELITGQTAISNNHIESNLTAWVEAKLNDEGVHGVIDQRLSDFNDESSLLKIIELGIMCSAFNKDDRPSMKEVISILEANIKSLHSSLTKIIGHLSKESYEQYSVNSYEGSSDDSTKTKALFNTSSDATSTLQISSH